jgi:hypothetical protein
MMMVKPSLRRAKALQEQRSEEVGGAVTTEEVGKTVTTEEALLLRECNQIYLKLH